MALFQKSVLHQYIKQLDKNQVASAYAIFSSHFHNATIQQQIRESKEEQYQEGFFRDLFVEVLGFTLNPQPNYNLITEQKNEVNSKKADGAILKNGEVLAVIELKGTNTTDLNTVTGQAFGYKNNQKYCKYVLISNFEKLRFYIDNAIDFEEFDLFTLTAERFSLLYLCLQANNLLTDVPDKIKQASTVKEENVTKQLYKDYSEFKRKLFADTVHLNPQFDKLVLFKKSQKLLDRILFILFAEDRGLLQANTIHTILDEFDNLKKLDAYQPLYSRFKKHFTYLNEGFKNDKYEVFGYNGGLFAPDDILDTITISDNILQNHIPTLSRYDYDTEVDVNILGHIFEHSLNDIEEIQAELEGKEIDKTKTKRKKDGVFYTPKYITKYIVENTVGALCTEKRNEYGIVEDNYTPDKRKAKKKELLQSLDAYQNWLLEITVVDPACGSGAFLNQALDFLIQEHKSIDELRAQLLGHSFILPDHESAILENNIFGVDLNEESVEIARLSLWLRTARKGRKLNSLNNNIKCGNSLIDDASIAGEKAFNWQNEFPKIFERGGFDVVIGNPPYVKARDNEDILGRNFIEKNYVSTYKMWDLYIPFIEKGMAIIKRNGTLSMIIPDTIGKAEYSKKLIDLINKNYYLYQIDFFPDIQVFVNVGVKSKIIFLKNIQKKETAKGVIHNPTIYDTKTLDNTNISLTEQYLIENSELNIKLKNCLSLGNICFVSYGMRLNSDKSDIDKFQKSDLLSATKNEINSKIYTEGKYIERFLIDNELFLEWGTERCPTKLVRPTFPELYPCEKLLLARQKRIATYTNDNHYCDNTIIMAILSKDLSNVNNNSINKYYSNLELGRKEIEKNSESFNLKYILSIINSKLIGYYIRFASKGNIDFYPDDWKRIPIKEISLSNQQPFVEKTETMLQKNKELQTIKTNVVKLLQSRYSGININTKLNNWNELTFKDFCKELEKQKIKLSISEQAELMHYFEAEQTKANSIQQTITQTDKEIDQMVYKLYDLTEEEIAIVENN